MNLNQLGKAGLLISLSIGLFLQVNWLTGGALGQSISSPITFPIESPTPSPSPDQPVNTDPIITNLSSDEVSQGDTVTIYGANFIESVVVSLGGVEFTPSSVSADGTSLQFVVSTEVDFDDDVYELFVSTPSLNDYSFLRLKLD